MSVDSVHALRVELAAALRERDAEREFRGAAEAAFAEQLARTEAAESALAAANARADAAEAKLAEALPCGSVLIVTGFDEEVYENHEETIGHVISELRESLAAANARADEWQALAKTNAASLAVITESLTAARRECEGLRTALVEAKEALEHIWAAIGDRLCGEGPLAKEYAHGVTRQVDAARARIGAALGVSP